MKKPTNRTQTVVANASTGMLVEELRRRGFRSFPEARIRVMEHSRSVPPGMVDSEDCTRDVRASLVRSVAIYMLGNSAAHFETLPDPQNDGGVIIRATTCMVLPKDGDSR